MWQSMRRSRFRWLWWDTWTSWTHRMWVLWYCRSSGIEVTTTHYKIWYSAYSCLLIDLSSTVFLSINKNRHETLVCVSLSGVLVFDLCVFLQVFGEEMQVRLYAPAVPVFDASIVVMLLIGVVTVALGGYWSGACERSDCTHTHVSLFPSEKDSHACCPLFRHSTLCVTVCVLCVSVCQREAECVSRRRRKRRRGEEWQWGLGSVLSPKGGHFCRSDVSDAGTHVLLLQVPGWVFHSGQTLINTFS